VTEAFEVNPNSNTYELEKSFKRTSNFYRDGSLEYQRKDCCLELFYSSVGREEATGSIEIDMGPLVGKGQVYQVYKLQGQTVT
jgi:hypothetical protein